MKIKQENNITKVGGRGDNLKLKAQSLKREFISRFQLLIIYINSMQKVNKKVREEKYDHYGHPTAIIIGLLIFAVVAVWAVVPVGGAEAAHILLVAISSIVVLLALDKAVNFDILDIQFKLLTPPALTLL